MTTNDTSATLSHSTSGVRAPVTEEITAFDLAVTGTIPAELDGRFLRNGPNPIGPTDVTSDHWFTGHGMVHGLRLRDGRAEWYRNRWVRTPDVTDLLGEPRCPSPFGDDVRLFSANTNVIGHAGRTLAVVEAGTPPVELTDEMDIVGPTNCDGTLREAQAALPDDPRTEKARRALDHTYFHGATSREAAAGTLHMAFSTYRRPQGWHRRPH
jgi:carotenoid cleavage oxygenase